MTGVPEIPLPVIVATTVTPAVPPVPVRVNCDPVTEDMT